MKQVRRMQGGGLEDIIVMRILCFTAGEPWKNTDPRLDHERANIVIWRGDDDAGVAIIDAGVIHTPFKPHETIAVGEDWPSKWEWGWAVVPSVDNT